MKFELGYDKTTKTLDIQNMNLLGVMKPNAVQAELTGAEAVLRALETPVGTPRLSQIVKPGEKIVIITSDITRPMPTAVVLPHVLKEIESAGCSLSDICIVFALGNHRKHTPEEQKYLLGEENFLKVKSVDLDTNDCVLMGTTKQGTPVEIFRPVAQADRVIAFGNVEYHYFAGYSGGAKAIMPGVSTHNAIQANHSMMVRDTAVAGRLDGNPVREDIDSVTDFVRLDFIINVVLDERKKIIHASAGHYIQAHRQACAFLDTLYKVRIERQADIVVASAGGYPKDINLYQAQKALDNAKHACRDGGIIILCACCKEGLGEEVFERWMTGFPCPADMVKEIACRFELGGHKAAAISMVLATKRIFLVSDMEPDFVRGMFMEPYAELQQAFDAARQQLGKDAQCYVMPYAGSTLPETVRE
jgi:nickel-dependent lactate racemase